jgi:hypothetical protein
MLKALDWGCLYAWYSSTVIRTHKTITEHMRGRRHQNNWGERAIAAVAEAGGIRDLVCETVWAFVDAEDYMRKEQQETITSAKLFGVDVVETV